MGNKVHPPETKAAVMNALLQGQSISSVAKQYSISKSTVSAWKKKGFDAIEPKKDYSGEIGGLIIDYLRQTLITLEQQAIAFRDPDWLAKQDASEVAVLHGVQTDKAIRLLEALSNAADD